MWSFLLPLEAQLGISIEISSSAFSGSWIPVAEGIQIHHSRGLLRRGLTPGISDLWGLSIPKRLRLYDFQGSVLSKSTHGSKSISAPYTFLFFLKNSVVGAVYLISWSSCVLNWNETKFIQSSRYIGLCSQSELLKGKVIQKQHLGMFFIACVLANQNGNWVYSFGICMFSFQVT